jgi:hypothetical protein
MNRHDIDHLLVMATMLSRAEASSDFVESPRP